MARVERGLRAIGDRAHLELFQACANVVGSVKPEVLAKFLDSTLAKYASNKIVRSLRAASKNFYELPDLTMLNAQYVRGLPNLRVLPMEDLKQAVEARVGRSIAW